MTQQAKGEFDVKRTPAEPCDGGDGTVIGHNRFDKVFHGPLDARSVVHMLMVGTETQGSAAYVAIERIAGTLDTRSGSFHMQHNGIMKRGAASLSLTVVPDSGTDALTGLSGSMAIDIVDGKHFYTLDYSLEKE
ncbi:MAG: DUF3224 domain-containing protein [Luteimonas sp.]